MRPLFVSIAHQAHHFLATAMIFKEATKQARRRHANPVGANAAPGHTTVLRFDHDGNALRMQIIPNALRHLRGQPFLHL